VPATAEVISSPSSSIAVFTSARSAFVVTVICAVSECSRGPLLSTQATTASLTRSVPVGTLGAMRATMVMIVAFAAPTGCSPLFAV